MTPAEFSIRRPITICMFFVSMLILGMFASQKLPLELFPNIEPPFLLVSIPYPGSTPVETERVITAPAEEILATLKGVTRISSGSDGDGTQIAMLFDWDMDISTAAVEARARLEASRDQFPSDLRRFLVLKFNTQDQEMLSLRISSELDLSNAYDKLQRNLVRPVERLEGVARVELQGIEPREIHIDLMADRVEAFGINLAELNELLSRSNFSSSAGLMNHQGRRYLINPVGEFKTVEQIRSLVINSNGTRLSDVAEISYAPGDRDYSRHLDGNYAVGLQIFRERGANLVDVAGRVLTAVNDASERDEMKGIELFILENQAEGVTSSLSDLLSAGLLGALFSLIVLYLFIRNIPMTLMVSLAVPVSITMALGVMYLLGLTLNILSMMGLMLAVGMLVDNAVVVSESIISQREHGQTDPVKAAIDGVKGVGLAVLAGTMTTMAVFLPNIFGSSDIVSLFLRDVAIAICVSLLASLLIAQTLIPMLSTRLAVREKKKSLKPDKTPALGRLKDRYGRFLGWTLTHRWLAWGLIIAYLLSVAIPMNVVETEMNPETNDRRLFLQYNLLGDYTLEQIEANGIGKIENWLFDNRDELEIDSVYSYWDENGEAQTTILLTDDDLAIKDASLIKEMIRDGMPAITIGKPTFGFQQNDNSNGASLLLYGDSSQVLADLSEQIMFHLSSIEGLVDLTTDQSGGDREINVVVNRDKAARYGLNATQIASVISFALRGTELNSFRGPDGEVPIRWQFRDADSQTVDNLKMIKLDTQDGERVPLSAVVDISMKTGPQRINRDNRKTALTVQASLQDMTLEAAKKAIEERMGTFVMPPGYSWSLGRGFELEQEQIAKMIWNLALAVILIFLIMAALFESLIHPFTIVTGVVFSIVGVYWFFMLTGTSFSLMAMIGMLILIGVVVNNGIVLIDHINRLRRDGLSRSDAVLQGGRDRLRPILMTVATTVLGLLPLCFGSTQLGGGGPAYFPMARAIVGGLIFSTIISLCVLPTIYVTLDDLGLWGKRQFRRSRQRLESMLSPRQDPAADDS